MILGEVDEEVAQNKTLSAAKGATNRPRNGDWMFTAVVPATPNRKFICAVLASTTVPLKAKLVRT